MQKTIGKQTVKKSKSIFTLSEDTEIKKLLTIMRAVPKERQISIIETLRIYYGFYVSKYQIQMRTFTVDDYERLKSQGIFSVKR
jgi:hypothetical protein